MKTLFINIRETLNKGQDAVLVTIVSERGSSPRGAGARMLVGKYGRIYGTVGGGAIEHRSEKMARELVAEHRSQVHSFKLYANAEEDLGMLCGGEVTVKFQYIAAGDEQWLVLAADVLGKLMRHERGWLVERTEADGMPVLYNEGDMAPIGLSGDVPLIADGYFAEPLDVGERVIIFGGGHIAQELVPVIAHLGFRPVVFENRAEYADLSLFPGAELSILGDYERIADDIELTDEDYIVVMTNGHAYDYTVELQALRGGKYAYLGVIGSRSKIVALNRRLLMDGVTQEQIDTVHTPIGVAIKAVTPAEIAISIAGELIMIRTERRSAAGENVASCPMHA